MKKGLIAASLLLASVPALASQNQSYKLITVSTYLNFYLLNLNACEDFHPGVRSEAYAAEAKLYPYFEKLDKKVAALKIDENDKAAIANTVSDRRIKLNSQIAEGEFTVEHCQAVISIVNEGLDPEVLKSVN
jgi:hypothetical protein